jgi:hypothetical protein
MKTFFCPASDARLSARLRKGISLLLTAAFGSRARAGTTGHQADAATRLARAVRTGTLAICVGASAAACGNNSAGEAASPASSQLPASSGPVGAGPADAPGTIVVGDGAGPLGVPATKYNYYVSPNGNDKADGSADTPFQTLARAAKAATQASTTVWVAPGTYAGGFQTTANGTATDRIYWMSTTKWGARIVPPSNSKNNFAWDNRGNYVSIIGFEIDGSQAGGGVQWSQGIYTGGSYGLIQANHVHHIATAIPCTGAGGSAIGADSYYHGVQNEVIGNEVHDIGMPGCAYIHGIYVSTTGSIQNNLVYRVGEAAIHLWHDAKNVEVTNNTVASSHFGIIVGGGNFYYSSEGNDHTMVNNNIVVNNTYGISEQGKTGVHNIYSNNLLYGNNGYAVRLRNGLSATATVASSPLFVGYVTAAAAAGPDFHLQVSSPAIGRGTSQGAAPTDLDGKRRNAITGYDIGAYQH